MSVVFATNPTAAPCVESRIAAIRHAHMPEHSRRIVRDMALTEGLTWHASGTYLVLTHSLRCHNRRVQTAWPDVGLVRGHWHLISLLLQHHEADSLHSETFVERRTSGSADLPHTVWWLIVRNCLSLVSDTHFVMDQAT